MEPRVIRVTKPIYSSPSKYTILEEDIPEIIKNAPTTLITTKTGRWACPKCTVRHDDVSKHWSTLPFLGWAIFSQINPLPRGHLDYGARDETPSAQIPSAETPSACTSVSWEFESDYSWSVSSNAGDSMDIDGNAEDEDTQKGSTTKDEQSKDSHESMKEDESIKREGSQKAFESSKGDRSKKAVESSEEGDDSRASSGSIRAKIPGMTVPVVDESLVWGENLVGALPASDFAILEIFRNHAKDIGKPWPSHFYQALQHEDSAVIEGACFLNPPQAFECLNYAIFDQGNMESHIVPCGFSRGAYSSKKYPDLDEDTLESKQQLQKMSLGFPDSNNQDPTNAWWGCPKCLVYLWDLEKNGPWKRSVMQEPSYQVMRTKPRWDIHAGLDAPGPWGIYINSFARDTEMADDPHSSKTPGIVCGNKRYGRGLATPNTPCAHTYGRVVEYFVSGRVGLHATTQEPPVNGPPYRYPRDITPTLPERDSAEIEPELISLAEAEAIKAELKRKELKDGTIPEIQKALGMRSDGHYYKPES